MAEFGLVRSFGIDNGELAGMTPQECFVLGYELAQIDALAESGEKVLRPVHSANRERIFEAYKKHGRRARLLWSKDDCSEQWMTLDYSGD